MDAESHLDWLRTAGAQESGGGFDLGGWPASIWVLHTVWETEMLPDGDEPIESEPVIFGGVPFRAAGVLGWPEPEPGPEQGWRRVEWRELCRRAGQVWPPTVERFPDFTWLDGARRAGQLGPAEGSLDSHTLPLLMEHLSVGTTSMTVYWGGGATQWSGPVVATNHPWCVPLHLGRPGQVFTPSNMWPDDRRWLTWTDYDLQGTRVDGSVELITAIDANPLLETVLP